MSPLEQHSYARIHCSLVRDSLSGIALMIFCAIALSRASSDGRGTLRFHRRLLYIANSLVDQHIELEETNDVIWSIYFHTVLLCDAR